MNPLDVAAQHVRLSAEIAKALAERRPVAVNRYGKRIAVLLSREQFDLVSPLLDVLQESALVSPELLKSYDDLELERALADDRMPADAESARITELLEASQEH